MSEHCIAYYKRTKPELDASSVVLSDICLRCRNCWEHHQLPKAWQAMNLQFLRRLSRCWKRSNSLLTSLTPTSGGIPQVTIWPIYFHKQISDPGATWLSSLLSQCIHSCLGKWIKFWRYSYSLDNYVTEDFSPIKYSWNWNEAGERPKIRSTIEVDWVDFCAGCHPSSSADSFRNAQLGK